MGKYCDFKDPEKFTIEGANVLMEHACEMGLDDWSFVECKQDQKSPQVLHAHYRKDTE